MSFAGTTWYFNGEDSLGLSYEVEKLDKTNTTGGNITHKHYFSAGGMVFASYDLKGVSTTTGYTCPAGQTLSGSECLQTTQTAATTGGLSCPVGSMADGAGLSQTPPECYQKSGSYTGLKNYYGCPAGFLNSYLGNGCVRGPTQNPSSNSTCPVGSVWARPIPFTGQWKCVFTQETVMSSVYQVYTCPYGGKTAPLLHAYDVRSTCYTQTVAPVASYTCPAGQTLSGTTCTNTTRTAATPGSNFSTFTIQTQRVLYFHHDHLGSVIALSDQNGAVVERMAFDAWGKRRNINGLADPLDQIQGVYQDRGYTMHEMMDEMGLIHMNGRVYDPYIGRFMSADPYIQAPDHLGSYNRYSYVWNNPLAMTDPTGYFSWKKFVKKWLRPILAVAAAFVLGPAGPAWMASIYGSIGVSSAWAMGAIAGAAAGAISTGTLRGALAGALGGALFAGIGASGLGDVGRIAAHAAAGCVSALAGGGSCAAGALSAGFGKVASLYGLEFGDSTWGKIAGGVQAAIVGGTASVLGGGNFENGAVTAAMGYVLNHWQNLAKGKDAELAFKNHLKSRGVLGDNGPYYDKANFARFMGYPDLYSGSMVWDVKPESIYGWASGTEQITRYSLASGLMPGTNVIMDGASSITLQGSIGTYNFRFAGYGLVMYNVVNSLATNPVLMNLPAMIPSRNCNCNNKGVNSVPNYKRYGY